jgi:hypothetical protein
MESQSLWVARNIENKTLAGYFSVLSLTSLSTSLITDLDITGLTIEANKGGPLVLRNTTAGGISITSPNGNINISSTLGDINLTAKNIRSPSIRFYDTATAPLVDASNGFSLWKTNISSVPQVSIYNPALSTYNLPVESFLTITTATFQMVSNPVGSYTANTTIKYFKIGRMAYLLINGGANVIAPNFTYINFTLPVGVPLPISVAILQSVIMTACNITTVQAYVRVYSTGVCDVGLITPITVPPYPAIPQFTPGLCGFTTPTMIMYETTE